MQDTEMMTAKAFASLFKVHRHTVDGWISAGMPCEKHGGKHQINLRDAVPWLIEYWEQRTKPTSAREQLAKVQADGISLHNEKERKSLLRFDHVEHLRDSMLTSLDNALAGMVDRVASKLTDETNPAICRQMVLDEHHAARQVHAEDLQDIFEAKSK